MAYRNRQGQKADEGGWPLNGFGYYLFVIWYVEQGFRADLVWVSLTLGARTADVVLGLLLSP